VPRPAARRGTTLTSAVEAALEEALARSGQPGGRILDRLDAISSHCARLPRRDRVNAALDAWMRCGKGRHPAALNFGECFAYALASLRGARLLFVGEDFARTDAAALG